VDPLTRTAHIERHTMNRTHARQTARRTARHTATAVAIAGLAAAGAAQAQDWTVKTGITRYDAHSKSNGIKGIGIPPGADAIVGDATTVIFVLERTFSPNFAAELVLGIPPRVKAKAAGSVAFLGDDVLSAKNVAPTFIVNYYIGDGASRLRPYVGVGVNYTSFKSVKSKLAPEVFMSDSFGLVVQGGLSYAVNKNMGLFASVARIDVRTDIVGIASTVLTSSIDFRPWTYSAGLWYKF
jgi:outer membrane protein